MTKNPFENSAKDTDSSGLHRTYCRNGKQALDFYKEKQEQISLVVLDLLMPEMGGNQCLRELLTINPRVKVLIATGCNPCSSASETADIGAKGFVSKTIRW